MPNLLEKIFVEMNSTEESIIYDELFQRIVSVTVDKLNLMRDRSVKISPPSKLATPGAMMYTSVVFYDMDGVLSLLKANSHCVVDMQRLKKDSQYYIFTSKWTLNYTDANNRRGELALHTFSGKYDFIAKRLVIS